MQIESVHTITNNVQQFLNQYIHVKCYICYNQDIQALYHVPTQDQQGYPPHHNNSNINFNYKNISNCSHSDLLKINLKRTVVIVSGTLEPFNKGETYPCPYMLLAKEVNIYVDEKDL